MIGHTAGGGVDKGHVAARAPGALTPDIVSPLPVLILLVDAGPESGSDCRQLLRGARPLPQSGIWKKELEGTGRN